MLAAADVNLQVAEGIDVALVAVGGLLLVAWVVQLFRNGRWRNPLADVAFTGRGPSIVHFLAVGMLWCLAAWALSPGKQLSGKANAPATSAPATAPAAVASMPATTSTSTAPTSNPAGESEADTAEPGSLRWHALHGADMLARLLCIVVAIVLLARHPSFAPDKPPRIGVLAIFGMAVGGVLVVIFVTTMQAQLVEYFWNRIYPTEIPPKHPVLLALRDSVLGNWGAVQLFIGAVVIAAVSEELAFRGLLLQGLWRATGSAWGAIFLSSLAFGFVHAQPQVVLPLASMGVILGYLRLRTRSLWLCILLHALFNARTMIAAILFPELLERSL